MKTFLFLLIFTFFQTKEYTGKIIYVTDGDNFTLQTEQGNLKIRMDGIDAPEMDQEYGKESKAFLFKYLHKECRVIYKGVDKYGRTIGVLYVVDVNINLLSVEKGFAWHYKKYSNDSTLVQAEVRARGEKKGLWENPNAIAPWEWRLRGK